MISLFLYIYIYILGREQNVTQFPPGINKVFLILIFIYFLAGEREVCPEVAAVLIPSTLKKGALLSCECDYKQSALHHGVGGWRAWFLILPKSVLTNPPLHSVSLCTFFLALVFLAGSGSSAS